MRIAIDVGTATTKAAVSMAGRAVPVLFDGEPTLPSGVWVHAGGALSAGRTGPGGAAWLADPYRLLATGNSGTANAVDPVEAVSVLLGHVAATAAGGDRITGAVLLVPAGWGPRRHALLREAAGRAGLPGVELLAAPVAAATELAAAGPAVPDGGCVLVCDVGAAAADIAVVERTAAGWQVLSMQEPPGCGGDDLDRSLTTALLASAAVPAAGLSPDQTTALTGRVRAARHALAGTDRVAVVMPDPHPPAILTADHVHTAGTAIRQRITAAAVDAVVAADISDDHLAAVAVLGGAAASLGLAPELHEHYALTPHTPQPADRVLPAAALRTGGTAAADGAADPLRVLGRGWARIWQLIALGIPLAAAWLLLWRALDDGLDIIGPGAVYDYLKLPVLFNSGALAMACLFATLAMIGAGRLGATALLDHAAATGDTGSARRAGRILAGGAFGGLAFAFIHQQLADTVIAAPGSTPPFMDHVLLASILVVVPTVLIGLVAPHIAALQGTRWSERLRYPMTPVILATAGTLSMSVESTGSARELQDYVAPWIIGLVGGRGGMLALGVAIAFTLATTPLPRIGLAVIIGFGGALIYTWQLQETMIGLYLASVVIWWVLQTGRIAVDATPGLRSRVGDWLRSMASTSA
ncbi:hypothetical protein F4553_008068 [Allocatelliglobosispora scoriae]|uniref:Hsp70 family protein n=1 Tax=Allocatelliglobosispora scoriae TaxID=643052 RepID=A0A841C2Q1_9ACTN|nr:Hsp70 family protein [Allocatelliglobosispora scoriae]MBB5874634.1 hypothetical protein [Allocatelliglobosispora scoriae]